jgi:hypothetical protein
VEADHLLGSRCEVFIRALQVMRYAEELRRAVSAGADRKQRRRLKKAAEDFSTVACADDVQYQVSRLAHAYEGDWAPGARRDATDEMLWLACTALFQGEDPAPIDLPPSTGR